MSANKEFYVSLDEYCSRDAPAPDGLTAIEERLGEHSKMRCINESQQKAFAYDHCYREVGHGKDRIVKAGHDVIIAIANHWLAMSIRTNCQNCLNRKCNFRRHSGEPYRNSS